MHESVLASKIKNSLFFSDPPLFCQHSWLNFLSPLPPLFLLLLSLDKIILSVLSRIFRHIRDNKDLSRSFCIIASLNWVSVNA